VRTAGTGTIYLETDSVTTYDVFAAGTADTGLQALNILGATIATLNIFCTTVSQTVGIATNSGETATVTNLTMTGGLVTLGVGATLSTAVECTGGTLHDWVATPTLTYGGSATVHSYGGNATLITGSGGILYYRNAVTCTDVKLNGTAEINMTLDLGGRTFTNVEMGEGTTFNDPYRTVTLTNGIDLPQTSIDNVTITRGSNVTATLNAI
jgi:hypothetical protein